MFHKLPSYVSRHGFDSKGGHSHTVVYRIEDRIVQDTDGVSNYVKHRPNEVHDSDADANANGISKESTNCCPRTIPVKTVREEVPCCIMLRDPIYRDVFDVTIAPGIDPLLIDYSKLLATMYF